MNSDENFTPEDKKAEDDQKIEEGFTQMEMLYRSRCVQPPLGKNVTVREIEKDE